MNARKAVDLGFADGILERERGVADTGAEMYSRAQTRKVLLNSIAQRVERSVDTLYERLERLK